MVHVLNRVTDDLNTGMRVGDENKPVTTGYQSIPYYLSFYLDLFADEVLMFINDVLDAKLTCSNTCNHRLSLGAARVCGDRS